jgi:hypothetical protein
VRPDPLLPAIPSPEVQVTCWFSIFHFIINQTKYVGLTNNSVQINKEKKITTLELFFFGSKRKKLNRGQIITPHRHQNSVNIDGTLIWVHNNSAKINK